MAKFPNTTPIKGISHSWTQSYPDPMKALSVLAGTAPISFEIILKELVESAVFLELEVLTEIDEQVEAMTEFPEALALIKGAVK